MWELAGWTSNVSLSLLWLHLKDGIIFRIVVHCVCLHAHEKLNNMFEFRVVMWLEQVSNQISPPT